MLPTIRRPDGPPLHTTEVVSAWEPTPSTRAITLLKPKEFRFRATQFTFLGLATPEGPAWHAMSLATSPTREHLEYAVRISPSAFKQAFSQLRPGDTAWVRGPIGEFFLDEERPAVLIAGGIGITPLKGMAEYASDKGLKIPVRLLYSSRSEEEIAYRKELEELAIQNSKFAMRLTLTKAIPRAWNGWTGRISAKMVKQLTSDLRGPKYYVCGTPEFVQDQLDLLSGLGVSEPDLDWEPFRGY